MAEKSKLLSSMLSMVGQKQQNIITIHAVVTLFMDGDLEATMLLEQLLYWTDRATMPNGWVSKSNGELQEELSLKRYSVRRAAMVLIKKSLIETKLKKFNAFPTTHYRVRIDELKKQWISFLRSSVFERTESVFSNKGFDEIAQTLTETSSKDHPRRKQQTPLPARGEGGSINKVLMQAGQAGRNTKKKKPLL